MYIPYFYFCLSVDIYIYIHIIISNCRYIDSYILLLRYRRNLLSKWLQAVQFIAPMLIAVLIYAGYIKWLCLYRWWPTRRWFARFLHIMSHPFAMERLQEKAATIRPLWQLWSAMAMKYLGAYLMAVLGGKEEPTAKEGLWRSWKKTLGLINWVASKINNRRQTRSGRCWKKTGFLCIIAFIQLQFLVREL